MISSEVRADIILEFLAGNSPGIHARIFQTISAGFAPDIPLELFFMNSSVECTGVLFEDCNREIAQGVYLRTIWGRYLRQPPLATFMFEELIIICL